MSFVTVQFPRCSICLENFGPDKEAIAHVGGEAHPFHRICFQEMIEAGNRPDPIFGVRPIRCPVCQIELSNALAENPLQNPSPSVRAASNQLLNSGSSQQRVLNSTSSQRMVSNPAPNRSLPVRSRYPDDARIPREIIIQRAIAAYDRGMLDEAEFNNCMEYLRPD